MNKTTFTGAFIKDSEQENILQYIKNSQKYKNLLEKMQGKEKFDEENITIQVAYKMSFFSIGPTQEPIQSKFVQIFFDNEKAEIRYDWAKRGEDTTEDFIGSIVHDSGTKITSFSALDSEKVKQNVEKNYNNEFQLPIIDNLPDDLNYDNNEEIIAPQWNIGGCMPSPSDGWYNHCGPGCGDGLATGGGAPINTVDSCCRTHDRCWDTFGDWDCQCDRNLIDCAENYRSSYPAAYGTIWGSFIWNAC